MYIAQPGAAVDVNLSCHIGERICYGAEGVLDHFWSFKDAVVRWGAGLNDAACNDCCDQCESTTRETTLCR